MTSDNLEAHDISRPPQKLPSKKDPQPSSSPPSYGQTVSKSNVAGANSHSQFYPGRNQLLLCAIFLISGLFLTTCTIAFSTYVSDIRNCRMSYMSPSYVQLSEFDGNYTRFHKYSLYWYKEKRLDVHQNPSGVPVLFIPGNAGSYRQVRAIAAEAANQKNMLKSDTNKCRRNKAGYCIGVRGLDFYTADFTEDLTAFHGKTLIDQAEYLNEAVEYILSLYPINARPDSVILMGHSMGGMVARTMVTLSNYKPGRISTILTLAAPHSAPPATLDRQVVKVYNKVNQFWQDAFFGGSIKNNSLHETALISIAGGGLDRMIPSELTSVSSLVPLSNGFNVYTTSIPHVWSAIDHQAIVWCDQFRIVVAKALLESVNSVVHDGDSSGSTPPLSHRMSIFRKRFLTGFEHEAPGVLSPEHSGKSDEHNSADDVLLIADPANIYKTDRVDIVTGLEQKPVISLIPLQQNATGSVLLDRNIGEEKENDNLHILACSAYRRHILIPEKLSDPSITTPASHIQVINTSGRGGSVEFECKDIRKSAKLIPRAASNVALAHSSDKEYFHYIEYVNTGSKHDYLAIVEASSPRRISWTGGSKQVQTRGGMVIAEQLKSSDITVEESLFRLTFGKEIRPLRQLATRITLPSVRSSLIALELRVKALGNSNRFQPFVRQYVSEPYETKFFLNIGDETVKVNTHGIAPFVPILQNAKSNQPGPELSFQIWADEDIQVYVRVDWFSSAGRLILHYRTALAIFPIAIAVLVVLIQFERYNHTGILISFGEGLEIFVQQCLKYTLGLSFVLPALIASPLFQKLLYLLEPSLASDYVSNANRYFLGLEGMHLCLLGPIFVIVATALCYLQYHITSSVVGILQCVFSPCGVLRHSTYLTRPVTFILLSASLIVPYQVLVLFACILQLITTTRTTRKQDLYNLDISVLVLILWIAPISMPVALIWLKTPGLGYVPLNDMLYNFVSTALILVLVDQLGEGVMLPAFKSTTRVAFTRGILAYIAFYTFIFGLQQAYWIHHLINLFCGWLLILYC